MSYHLTLFNNLHPHHQGLLHKKILKLYKKKKHSANFSKLYLTIGKNSWLNISYMINTGKGSAI